jgi:hypothetical protein
VGVGSSRGSGHRSSGGMSASHSCRPDFPAHLTARVRDAPVARPALPTKGRDA